MRRFTQHQLAERRGAGFTPIEVLIVVAIIGVFWVFAVTIIPMLAGGNLEEQRADAVRAAEAFGFSGVTITESSRWSTADDCGWNNENAYQATATNSNNEQVSLVICCGRGSKDCIVRVR